MKLPSMEFTFNLNIKGSITGEVFKGSFGYKRLSIGDQGKADVLKTNMNGDLVSIDLGVNKLHEMISWLRFGLIEHPDWWRESNFGIELYDSNVVTEIYNMAMDFEKEWKRKVTQNGKSTTKNSNSES